MAGIDEQQLKKKSLPSIIARSRRSRMPVILPEECEPRGLSGGSRKRSSDSLQRRRPTTQRGRLLVVEDTSFSATGAGNYLLGINFHGGFVTCVIIPCGGRQKLQMRHETLSQIYRAPLVKRNSPYCIAPVRTATQRRQTVSANTRFRRRPSNRNAR